MGCSGSNSKGDNTIKKSINYNLEVTYTHQESSQILSVGALDEKNIVYGLKGLIKIFDSQTKTDREFSKEHTKRVDGIKFLSSKLLLTFGQDKLIKIWDINHPKSLMTFKGHSSLIWDAIELKDGRILSTGDDKKVLIWSLERKGLDYPLTEDKDNIAYAAQLNDGTVVLTGGESQMLSFWDIDLKEKIDSIKLNEEIWTICHLSDNKLAIGCGSGNILIFDITSKNTLFTLEGDFPLCVHVIRELEPGWILSTTESKNLYIWNLNSPGDKFVLNSHENSVTDACKIQDKILVSVGKDKTLKIWN